MADRQLALQRAQLLLVEDLRHEPDVAHGHDLTVAAHGDPRRLLTPVLERKQGEVGEARHVVLRRIDAENAAFVARPVAIVELCIHKCAAGPPVRPAGEDPASAQGTSESRRPGAPQRVVYGPVEMAW